MPSRVIKFPTPPAKPGQAADVHTPRYAIYAPAHRRDPMNDRKGAMLSIVSILVKFIFKFIFYVVVFYTCWHLLTSYNIISAQPASGWTWLLAMRAIWSEVDRVIDDLEAKDKASDTTGFWRTSRRKVLANATEAAAFSTIIFLLGWLADAFQYSAILAATVTGGILLAVETTAGRLRHPRWLAAIDDFITGAFRGGFIAMPVYLLWLSSNGRSPDEGIWYFGIGLCAAIGGGVNLWRKSSRAG
jgi:hypothetical protein